MPCNRYDRVSLCSECTPTIRLSSPYLIVQTIDCSLQSQHSAQLQTPAQTHTEFKQRLSFQQQPHSPAAQGPSAVFIVADFIFVYFHCTLHRPWRLGGLFVSAQISRLELCICTKRIVNIICLTINIFFFPLQMRFSPSRAIRPTRTTSSCCSRTGTRC